MSKWAVLLERDKNWNLLQWSEKNRDKICIGYYRFLFSPLTIHSYKTCSPTLNNLPFFSSSRKVSRRRPVGQGRGPYWYLFTYVVDAYGLDLVKVEISMQVILSQTGSDRKEGASYASLAQRRMFALKAEHSESSILHFRHTWGQIWKADQSFSQIYLFKSWDDERPLRCKDQSILWLYIGIIWRTLQTYRCSESPPRLIKLGSREEDWEIILGSSDNSNIQVGMRTTGLISNHWSG